MPRTSGDSFVSSTLAAARIALLRAKNAEQQAAVLGCLIEAVDALIEHQADLALRQRAIIPLPPDAAMTHGSFGIDIS